MVLLYEYLTRTGFDPLTLIGILRDPARKPFNTRSNYFRSKEIVNITYRQLRYSDLISWGGQRLFTDFNLAQVITSPPRHIMNEGHLQSDVITRQVIPMIRRAIVASNPDLYVMDGNAWPGNAVLGRPDVSIFHWDGIDGINKEMRFPLEVKLSANWKSQWGTDLETVTDVQEEEYKQVLSQIHFYMDLYETRYGGVLTDQELVIVERGRHSGHLVVSQSIPFSDHGNFSPTQGQPTVALAIWCMSTQADWYLKGHFQSSRATGGLDEEGDEIQEGSDGEYVPSQ